jgi:hypothetical protein
LKSNSELIFGQAEKEAIEFSELFIKNGKIRGLDPEKIDIKMIDELKKE